MMVMVVFGDIIVLAALDVIDRWAGQRVGGVHGRVKDGSIDKDLA